MAFYVVQFLTGLASAASLFLVASGLSIIFGVTRIVNFAHGAFYMLGAYVAFTLTERFSGALGFWGGIVVAALVVAVVGVLVEMVLLRRIYHSPELFQLLATFGLTLMVEDLVVLIWGPDDLLGRRAPGFKGAVDFFGQNIPTYDLFLIVLGPVVLGVLWLLFQRTRWGILVRAATQDRDMVAALGVNQKWLFTSVFAVGVFLAALGGALQIPRDAVHHAMDLRIIVEVFVVVVIGGLGSIIGAFVAAVLVSELNAFGILIFPKISIILVFLVMAVVLIVRPWGLFGKPEAPARRTPGLTVNPWRPLTANERIGALAALAARRGAAARRRQLRADGRLGDRDLRDLRRQPALPDVGRRARLVRPCRLFRARRLWRRLPRQDGGPADDRLAVARPVARLPRRGGVRLLLRAALRRLFRDADARLCADRLVDRLPVGGGDRRRQRHFGRLAGKMGGGAGELLLAVAGGCGACGRRSSASSCSRRSAMRCARRGTRRCAAKPSASTASACNGPPSSSPARSQASRGALFAYLKGSVFPDNLGISLSVDALVMVLLGGVETVSGAVIGAIVYKALSIWLVSQTDLSKLVLGGFIVLIVVAFPKGIVGTLEAIIGAPAANSPPKPAARRQPRRGRRMSSRAHIAVGRGPDQILWRRACRARRVVLAEGRRNPGADRPERRRQEHLLRHAQRPEHARTAAASRCSGRTPSAASRARSGGSASGALSRSPRRFRP